jgi:hypothetical protein
LINRDAASGCALTILSRPSTVMRLRAFLVLLFVSTGAVASIAAPRYTRPVPAPPPVFQAPPVPLPVSGAPAGPDKRSADNTAPAQPLPPFDEVTQAVEKHFAQARAYRSGDILTREAVAPLFARLEKIHWKVEDRAEIEQQLLPGSDWMARQFATPSGRAFMRKMADLPHGFDRVDRLRRMPGGERQLADLVRSKDGYKMVEYMTTTRNGKNLGRLLSQAIDGSDFNNPTGRIYTELDLLKRLKKSYEVQSLRQVNAPVDRAAPPAIRPDRSPPHPAGSPTDAKANSSTEVPDAPASADSDPLSVPSNEPAQNDPFEK